MSEAGDRVLVGDAPAMAELRAWIARLAPLPTTVLVTGETGVGKGLVARELHRLSLRRHAPFVHVDCGALAPGVVESELFGHERGAFTGASAMRRGSFERARDGTILLDEIAELDGALQSKLLRVLQDREFDRLGGSGPIRMAARVIAATNRDIDREVREGSFRRDLYYRLNVARLAVPPLRERRSDVPGLLAHFQRELGKSLSVPPPALSSDAVERLRVHDWPGNVRELANVVERLLVHHPGSRVGAAEVEALLGAPPGGPGSGAPGCWRDARAAQVLAPGDPRQRIAAELRATGGNVSGAARRLGVPRSTLRRWIRRYRVE